MDVWVSIEGSFEPQVYESFIYIERKDEHDIDVQKTAKFYHPDHEDINFEL